MYDFDLIAKRIEEHNRITVTDCSYQSGVVMVDFLGLFIADFSPKGTGFELGIYEKGGDLSGVLPSEFVWYTCENLQHCLYVIDCYLLKYYENTPDAFGGLTFTVSSLVYRNPLAEIIPLSKFHAWASRVGYIKVDNELLEQMRMDYRAFPKVYKTYSGAARYGKANGEGARVISTNSLLVIMSNSNPYGYELYTDDVVPLHTPPSNLYIDKVRVANDVLKELNVTIDRTDNYVIATHSKLPVTVKIDLDVQFEDFVRNVQTTNGNLSVYDYFVRDIKKALLSVLPVYAVDKWQGQFIVNGNDIELFVPPCNYYSINLANDTVNEVKLPHYKAVVMYLITDFILSSKELTEVCDLTELLEMVAKSMGYTLKTDLLPTNEGWQVYGKQYSVTVDYLSKRNLSKLYVECDTGDSYENTVLSTLQTPKLMQTIVNMLKHFHLIGVVGVVDSYDVTFGITVTPNGDNLNLASIRLGNSDKATLYIKRLGDMWASDYVLNSNAEISLSPTRLFKAKYPSQLVGELVRHAFEEYGCKEYVRIFSSASTVTFRLYNACSDIQTNLRLAPFVKQLFG